MITVFLITAILILIYLAYPLWLTIITSGIPAEETDNGEITSVSLVLLSYNGKKYLEEKIGFLLKELSSFQKYELIIVDDYSNDGSRELLGNLISTPNIKLLLKTEHKGIPDSMNLGVENAENDYMIFCDQRQKLSVNILQNIVKPLKCEQTGAVSGCICHRDKENRRSMVRRHENYIKARESKAGSLIGVYGPFYAIKKQCYSAIPGEIILDDLYLSLRILKSHNIVFREDCRIIDENFSLLNDYRRTRRYVSGFLQILKDKTLIRNLNARQKTMLIWHKYLRLLIPMLLFCSYLASGFMIMKGPEYLALFCLMTIGGASSFIPLRFNYRFRMKNLVRINILYFIAISDIFFNEILFRSTFGGQRTAVSGRRSAVGGQQSAVGGQRSAVGGQRSAVEQWNNGTLEQWNNETIDQ